MVFVGALWISVGIATHERVPFVVGGGCLLLAGLVGLAALLEF